MRTRSGLLAQIALPILAALAVVASAAQWGTEFWPWSPNLVDLKVYVYTGQVLLDGGDILTARTPDTQLAFIYPPFAALLSVPLVYVPYTLLQVLWTAFNALAVVYVLFRAGVRGWVLSLAATACVLIAEPVRATLAFGQVNIFLMALVVADLTSGQRLLPTARRWLPVGVLTGIATAIKVTPALFILYLLATRQWRAARNATATAAGITLVMAALMPRESWGFWKLLLEGDTRTGPAHFLTNQSLLGMVIRLVGDAGPAHYAGLALSGAVGLLGVYVAALWYRRGETLLAISLCGVAALLASPLSWTHHFVWIVPLGAVLVTRRELPAVLRGVGAAFVLWVSGALFKYVIPWGGDVELSYAPWQQLLSVFGPLLGLAVLGVALVEARRPRDEPAHRPIATAAVQ
ncbi:glycosyltransferase 87 family protein [Actinopolymorpha alba]|uniref:glycosyltransferase 87 family protein n=1 Tax=Actinopolymorpha alba TaxID=533267 RepID=UPI00036B132C|nr:glycosyltransferase 87 family protein [Actinopolymorpha alba]